MPEISELSKNFIAQHALQQNVAQNNNTNTTSTLERSPSSDEANLNNKKKKIIIAATLLTTAAAAGAGIYALIRGKSTKLQEIKFNNGIASKNNKLFSGVVNDKLPNGDKITLEYVNGAIKKSTRSGQVNFEKTYETINNEQIVKITQNGKTQEINLSKVKNEVEKSQNELNELFTNNSELSAKEFSDKVDTIKYKNKTQEKKLAKITQKKIKSEAQQIEYKKTNKNRDEIVFEKGIAHYNSQPYQGKIYCEMKDGSKAVIECNEKGEIISSEVTGARNLSKKYYHNVNAVEVTKDGNKETINIDVLKDKAETIIERNSEFNSVIKEENLAKINELISSQEYKFGSEKLNEEQLEQLGTLRDKLLQKKHYDDLSASIAKSKEVSAKADELMKDPEFVKKLDEFMDSKVEIVKSKYDCTMVETSINEVLKDSILGSADDIPREIYHGTNIYSYNDIVKSGFSLDACSNNESGKGVYFSFDKNGAQSYCPPEGKVIEAQYTGRNIAKVKPGVVGPLCYNLNIRRQAQKTLGINNSELINELIARRYNQLLNDLGYDAVTSASRGAGCQYLNILNPKDIKITG